MKAYRVFGSVLGFLMILFNLTSMVSCKQPSGKYCCTYSYWGLTVRACEGDSYKTYSYAGVSENYDTYYTLTGAYWDYIKSETAYYGGTCS